MFENWPVTESISEIVGGHGASRLRVLLRLGLL